MGFEVACTCGTTIPVSEGMAGSTIACRCGKMVNVPLLSALSGEAITADAAQLGAAEARPMADFRATDEVRQSDEVPFRDETPSISLQVPEVRASARVYLGTEGHDGPGRRAWVQAALTPESVWIQDTWQLRVISLSDVRVAREGGGTLVFTCGPEASGERLTLALGGAAEADRWHGIIQKRQQEHSARLAPEAAQPLQYVPEGVSLVRRAPDVPYVVLGPIDFTATSRWAAARGIQLRAAMVGADAIIDVRRRRGSDMGWSDNLVTGVSVRIENPDARRRFRQRFYAEAVHALTNRMVLLVLGVALLLSVGLMSGGAGLNMPTGQTGKELLEAVGIMLGLVVALPLVLLALVRVLYWPGLLRSAGLAVLTVTAGRTFTVWLAHLAAARTARAAPADIKLWILADPFEWAIVIFGTILSVRAWRLAREARTILPQDLQTASTARKAWTHGLLTATAVYALAFLGLAATSRYEASSHVLMPGVDLRREQEALLALNDGVLKSQQGDLVAGERAFQRSLQLWEELTSKPSVPSIYRANLAQTLYNLGWTCEQKGRKDEAVKYYARVVTLADALAGDPQVTPQLKQSMEDARAVVADLGRGEIFKQLVDKDHTAYRKCEDADVKARNGNVEAERLYEEAIALWEEVLPQATNEVYRKSTVAQLATVHLLLGEWQVRLGKNRQAAATLKKAIDYGEKAVAQEPDRPLPKHNLGLARRLIEDLGELALQDEIDKLCTAGRNADAVAVYARAVEEQEKKVQSGKDRDAALRCLALRLERFAWFLAHCPDARSRDTKTAVKHASRATQLQPDVANYWYALAMVQYRNRDWQDSLGSLEKVRAREGGVDASCWFLNAMNRYQLKQHVEARDALRRGVESMQDLERKAAGNAQLRMQHELARPTLEGLRREAENLIEGRDPASKKVGA